MSTFTVTDLKTDLAGLIHSTDVNSVPNITYLINRAARKLISDIDIAECKRFGQLTSPIYGEVYSYALPSDLKANSIIDIRPAQETISDSNSFGNFVSLFTRDFMRYKESGTFNVTFNQMTKFLRLSASIGSPIILNLLNSITDNGTWAVGGNGTNLTVDNLNYLSGGASLAFDTTVGTSAYIENSTMTTVDLSDLVSVGAVFLYVYLPTSSITNVNLRWGSSSSDYYSVTVTAQQDGTAFIQGWNLLQFNYSGATETGTVVDTAIDYSRITFTYPSATLTGFRCNNLVAQLGKIFDIEYYSNALFRDSSTGAFKQETTTDTDLINLSDESYNIFLNVLADLASQQIGGETSQYDTSYLKNDYIIDKKNYLKNFPSESIKPRTSYWIPPNRYRNNRVVLNS